MRTIKLPCVADLSYCTCGEDIPVPQVLDEVEATAEGLYYDAYGQAWDCWQLKGYPKKMGYDKRAFAILPGLSADEMDAIEKEAIK